jgi:hypothetical protein
MRALAVILALAVLAVCRPADIAEAQGTASATSQCSSEQRAVKRHKRGTAAHRRALKRYHRCLKRARTAPTPAPAPAPAEPPAPAPTPAAPVTYPNPNGYVTGQGCLRSSEATFNAAGFTCQFAGYYQQVYLYPAGWVSNPVYVLFPLCADGTYGICR